MLDVIVPVYNQPHVLRLCLASLLRTRSDALERVICVLDGCDDATTALAKGMLANVAGAEIVELPKNQGFVQACNAGFARSEAEIAVLVNSDTCATPGWEDAVLACFASDARIGVASPLSNFCPHNTAPMTPGANYLDMAAAIRRIVTPKYPDIATCEGFFYALRKSCRREIGVLDDIFDRGYCEESDLSMRANYFGWRTVLIDNLYIFHHGRQTFGSDIRELYYNRNKQVFFDRWNPPFAAAHEERRAASGLDDIRALVAKSDPLRLPAVKWV